MLTKFPVGSRRLPEKPQQKEICVKINIQEDSVGNKYIGVNIFGYDLIGNPILNKGRSFSLAERESLNLLGLLPPGIITLEEEVEKTYHILKQKLTL